MKSFCKLILCSFLIGYVLMGVSGCQGNMNQNKDVSKIVSLLIDKKAFPSPPPPPPPGLSDSLFQVKSDSIMNSIDMDKWKNQKLIVAVDTLLEPLSSRVNVSLEQYDELIENLNMLLQTQSINIGDILEPRGVEIRSVSTDLDGRVDYRSIDMYLSISNIAFNKNKTSAALVYGESRGRLNGYASIVILKKIKGQWVIVVSKMLEIS